MRAIIFFVVGVIAISCTHSKLRAQGQGGRFHLSSSAYQPNSPQIENRLFRFQTGHYGRFYNCDGEEGKRCSPYIQWAPAVDRQLPKPLGWRTRIRHEVQQVLQRIADGSCNKNIQVAEPCHDCVSSQAFDHPNVASTDMYQAPDEETTQRPFPLAKNEPPVRPSKTLFHLPPKATQTTTASASSTESPAPRTSGLVYIGPQYRTAASKESTGPHRAER